METASDIATMAIIRTARETLGLIGPIARHDLTPLDFNIVGRNMARLNKWVQAQLMRCGTRLNMTEVSALTARAINDLLG